MRRRSSSSTPAGASMSRRPTWAFDSRMSRFPAEASTRGLVGSLRYAEAASAALSDGNAANVSANVQQVVRLRKTGLNVFILDYRGYGHSTGGPPREKLLYGGWGAGLEVLGGRAKYPG